MYKVLCDNALMCDSRIDELALISPKIDLEENKAGSFSFKIPPNHPMYDAIQRRKSIVEVYQDDELKFCGICIEVTTDFYKQKNVYCEGEMTFLNDSIQRPAQYGQITVRGLLETYIANHNSQVDSWKQFQVGIVTVTDPNDSLYCFTNMESTMQCLKEDLVDDLGGFFRIRHADGIRYIDYLADSQNTNSQVIKLGKNLMDFTNTIDSTDIATAIIPLGEKLEESTVEGLETRLTIESVNDGKDYVYNKDAVNTYGWIFKTVEYDNVTTASALKSKGEQYLTDIQFENMVIEAKAIDLHLTDKDIECFKISDKIRVVSSPHGLDRFFRLTKMTINLDNPAGNTITLGKEEKVGLSAKTSSVSDAVKKAVESIVPPSSILNQAVENATQLITNAMGGYVYKTNNELYIMDTNDPETAQRVWRWNINGLGYSSTGINGTYGLAMTMDGSIVADFITSGILSGDRVKGGTYEVGGTGYGKDGSIVVKNATGKVLITIDKNGIALTNGQKIKYSDISDTPSIPTDISDLSDDSEKLWNTTIAYTWIKTANVYAQNLKAGSVDAENITGTTISGKTLDGGVIKQAFNYYDDVSASTLQGNLYLENGILYYEIAGTKTPLNYWEMTSADFLLIFYSLYVRRFEALALYVDDIIAIRTGVNGFVGEIKCSTDGVRTTMLFSNDIAPASSDAFYCGTSSNMWYQVFSRYGVSSSDRNQKNTIESIDEKYEKLFDLLNPVSYYFNNDEEAGKHLGFIAQDVEDAIESSNLSHDDFGAVVKSEEGRYSLMYNDFIALNTHMIKKQQKEIESLKQEVAELKALVKSITEEGE